MEDLERLAKRDIEDTPAMRADPALPVYVAIMRRIVELMPSDPAPGGTEGDELNALVETALVYERRWFPEFSPTRGVSGHRATRRGGGLRFPTALTGETQS